MNENIIIMKKQGIFYNAIGDDAIILSYITGYKYRDNLTCGFHEKCLDSVVNVLEKNCISYKIETANICSNGGGQNFIKKITNISVY